MFRQTALDSALTMRRTSGAYHYVVRHWSPVLIVPEVQSSTTLNAWKRPARVVISSTAMTLDVTCASLEASTRTLTPSGGVVTVARLRLNFPAASGHGHRGGTMRSYTVRPWRTTFVTARSLVSEISLPPLAVIADELDDPRMRVSAIYCEAQTRQALGEYAMTAELLRSCLAAMAGGLTSHRFGSTDFTRVFSSSRLATTLAELGDFSGAGDAARRRADGGTPASPVPVVFRLPRCGLARAPPGPLRRGRAWLERLRDMQANREFEVSFPVAGWMLAYAYARARRPDAEALLVCQISPLPSKLRIFTYPLWLGCLADACLLTGRPVETHALATMAVELGRAIGEQGHAALASRTLGDVAVAKGDATEARRAYGEALAIARALGMRPLEAHCLEGLGDRATARAMYRQMRMESWLERWRV